MTTDPRLVQLRCLDPRDVPQSILFDATWPAMLMLVESVLEHDTSVEQPNCRMCNALALAVLDTLGGQP